MKEADVVKTKAKCPKCGSTDLQITEVWEGHTITWEQIDGKMDRNEGNMEVGDPYKVQGLCNCGHRWTLRNAFQIDDILK